MPHKMFVKAYRTGPVGYLIATHKAVVILLGHKIHDARLQLFLVRWTAVLMVLLAAGVCGFNPLPMLLALGAFFPIGGLCTFLLWLGAGDIFLKFVLEDEWFYQLATRCHALSVFEDSGSSLPQPTNDEKILAFRLAEPGAGAMVSADVETAAVA